MVALNEVAAFDGSVVLFVDDVHAIAGAEGIAELQALLDHAPENLRIVVASRRITRLRNDGHLLELRDADFAVSLKQLPKIVAGRIAPPFAGRAARAVGAHRRLALRHRPARARQGPIAGRGVAERGTAGTDAAGPGLRGGPRDQSRRGHYRAAISSLERILDAGPAVRLPRVHVDVLVEKIAIALEHQDTRTAGAYSRSLDEQLAAHAHLYIVLGAREEAAAMLREAIRLDPCRRLALARIPLGGAGAVAPGPAAPHRAADGPPARPRRAFGRIPHDP